MHTAFGGCTMPSIICAWQKKSIWDSTSVTNIKGALYLIIQNMEKSTIKLHIHEQLRI